MDKVTLDKMTSDEKVYNHKYRGRGDFEDELEISRITRREL